MPLALIEHVDSAHSSPTAASPLGVYPTAGTIDGYRGDPVLRAPPYTVRPHGIEMIVERLGVAVDAMVQELTLTRAP